MYVDCFSPMGCSVSRAYFEAFSTFLEWVVKRESMLSSVLHYLDDFFFVGPSGTRVCVAILQTMERVVADFAVPLAPEKTEGLSTWVKFLGILIDSDRMECRLPEDKVKDLRFLVHLAKGVKKLHLREVQSFLGKLNFTCRILTMGRVFCRRLSTATLGVL